MTLPLIADLRPSSAFTVKSNLAFGLHGNAMDVYLPQQQGLYSVLVRLKARHVLLYPTETTLYERHRYLVIHICAKKL